MKRKYLLLTAALLVNIGLASALAGTTETVTVTATVPSVLERTTSSNIVGITMTAADYAAADAITKAATAAHNLTVRANRNWILNVKSATANFTFTPSVAGDTRTKPASDLEVRKAGGTYQGLSTTDATIATGSRGGVSQAGNSFAVDYQVATDIALDPPGTYSLAVVYTLTAP